MKTEQRFVSQSCVRHTNKQCFGKEKRGKIKKKLMGFHCHGGRLEEEKVDGEVDFITRNSFILSYIYIYIIFHPSICKNKQREIFNRENLCISEAFSVSSFRNSNEFVTENIH